MAVFLTLLASSPPMRAASKGSRVMGLPVTTWTSASSSPSLALTPRASSSDCMAAAVCQMLTFRNCGQVMVPSP